jgi:cobalt-zinc-cadmium efflux system protein
VHMFSDAASLGLAGAAAFLARRRASIRRTYGYKRVEILAAFANSLSLLWLSIWLAYQAVDRFRHPLVVQGQAVLLVALMGLAVNVILIFWLHHGEGEHSLNEQGVLWHVIGDTLSSVAAVAAGGWITLTGWSLADPILALLVVAILCYGSIRLLFRAGHILVEGTPEGLNTDLVRADLLAQPQVTAVHDLHFWTLDGRDLYASAHIATCEGVLTERDIATALTRLLTERHHCDHVTLQVGHCDDLSQGDCGAHCGDPHP